MGSAARESDQVRKARSKLKRQVEEEKKLMTPEAVKEMQEKIYRWIERHSRERINLREKNIELYSLFDTNEHPAKTTSKFVQRLRSQISTDSTDIKVEGKKNKVEKKKKLFGRVKKVKS